MYEINVFNIEASGDTFEQRSTFEDLHNAEEPHTMTTTVGILIILKTLV